MTALFCGRTSDQFLPKAASRSACRRSPNFLFETDTLPSEPNSPRGFREQSVDRGNQPGLFAFAIGQAISDATFAVEQQEQAGMDDFTGLRIALAAHAKL